MSFKSGLGSHPTRMLSTSPVFYSRDPPTPRPVGTSKALNSIIENRPVSIGNDVWIGTGVTILDGISIGDGAIIGAGCLVSRDVKPYSIVAGVPGRSIGERFNQEIVDSLLKIRWWDYNLSHIPQDEIYRIFAGELTSKKLEKLEQICDQLTPTAEL